MSNIWSEILHNRIIDGDVAPAVTPLYQTSAFESSSDYFYTRKNNPNSEELESIMKKIDCASYAICTTTGMTAIFMCVNLLHEGDSVVICSKIYGCTFKLFQKYCSSHGIELEILDLSNDLELNKLDEKSYDMCFFETPTNPFLDTIDIARVSSKCKNVNPACMVVVDNTWATPLFQNPLKHGADICVYSGTKYFGGHSDVMSGFITTNKDDIYSQLKDIRFYGGMILSPESAWLVRRSLQTFKVRITAQSITTKLMVDWLNKQSFITKVFYPNIDGVQLRDYGGIVFVEVDNKSEENYSRIINRLKLFGTGTGMACVTSMIAQPYTGSHASLTKEEKAKMGIKPNLIRLCFGLEDVTDIQQDLHDGFSYENF